MTQDPDDLLALENQVCFAVAVAARTVLGVYRPVLEPLGLTHPQYLVMLALWEHGDLSVGQLGTLLRLDSATLSPLLRRLEEAGFVTRQRRRADERVVDVRLTATGRELRTQALDVPHRVVERIGLSIGELEALRTSLQAFVSSADEAAVV
jgi:DNA-binding MarR family transcriptional regulator